MRRSCAAGAGGSRSAPAGPASARPPGSAARPGPAGPAGPAPAARWPPSPRGWPGRTRSASWTSGTRPPGSRPPRRCPPAPARHHAPARSASRRCGGSSPRPARIAARAGTPPSRRSAPAACPAPGRARSPPARSSRSHTRRQVVPQRRSSRVDSTGPGSASMPSSTRCSWNRVRIRLQRWYTIDTRSNCETVARAMRVQRLAGGVRHQVQVQPGSVHECEDNGDNTSARGHRRRGRPAGITGPAAAHGRLSAAAARPGQAGRRPAAQTLAAAAAVDERRERTGEPGTPLSTGPSASTSYLRVFLAL